MTRLGMVQMVSSSDVDTNLARVAPLVAEVVASGADMVFLPENWAAFATTQAREIGETESGPAPVIRACVSSLAAEHSVWIAAGTLPMATRPDGALVGAPRARAASLVFDASGREVARYDKIHMFDVDVEDATKRYRESERFEAGTELITLDWPGGVLGLTVCYDLRFPEVYRELALREATIIAAPCAFTEVTGKTHFELLIRARAVETQAYMVAACQGGVHDSGRRTWGHSLIVDPLGEVLLDLGRGEATGVVEVDPERIAAVRANMPIARQRRLAYPAPIFPAD